MAPYNWIRDPSFFFFTVFYLSFNTRQNHQTSLPTLVFPSTWRWFPKPLLQPLRWPLQDKVLPNSLTPRRPFTPYKAGIIPAPVFGTEMAGGTEQMRLQLLRSWLLLRKPKTTRVWPNRPRTFSITRGLLVPHRTQTCPSRRGISANTIRAIHRFGEVRLMTIMDGGHWDGLQHTM